MYNIEMLKTLINAGCAVKPTEVPQELWDQALASCTPSTVVEAEIVTQNTAVAVATPTTAVVVAAQDPSVAFTAKESYGFDDFQQTGMAVDGILKLKNGTPFVLNKEVVKMPFKATLLFDETRVKQSIKVDVNGETQYFSTYGGGVDSRDGTSFADKVAYCQRINPKAWVYPSAELIFILEEDLKDTSGKVIAPKGTKIGHSTSATNKKNVESFYNACKMKGIDTKADKVLIQVGYETKQNERNQVWTVLTFDLV